MEEVMPATTLAASEIPEEPTPALGAGQEETDTLGDPGKKALQIEREKRHELEVQVRDLLAAQEAQKSALAKALGLQPEDTSDQLLARQVADLQEHFTKAQHQNAVLAVANDFHISDKEDLKLLAAVIDVTLMREVAERIGNKATTATSPAPRADLSQGGKHVPAAGDPAQDFANFLQNQMT